MAVAATQLRLPRARLTRIYRHLHACYGHQQWWPGETPFEIIVGAVLTQNTAWSNVEKAIANLKTHQALSPGAILDAPDRRLAQWLRPSGYFNVKARRLRNVCQWYVQQGGYSRLKYRHTAALRRALLAINGVGPETADDILLYAFGRPVFVIDAYTRRLLGRLGLVADSVGYESLRLAMETALGADAALFNDYHAQIVRHAREVCRARPQCGDCVLRRGCETGRRTGQDSF